MVYMATFILGMFGVQIPFIHGSGLFGHWLQRIRGGHRCTQPRARFRFHRETARTNGAPKYMEWLGAFGLMVTLVWLYIEILHLLMKLRSR